MVSWWWSTCKTKGDGYGHKKQLADRGLSESFEDFLVLWKEKGGHDQAHAIGPLPRIGYTHRIDHIIKLENLEQEFNKLPFIKKHINIPQLNERKKPPIKELITPTAGKLLNEMYANDFKLLNYPMEDF